MIRMIVKKTATKQKADLLALFMFEKSKQVECHKRLDNTLRRKIDTAISDFKFKGKEGEIVQLEGDQLVKRVLIVGLGNSGDFSDEKARNVAFKAADQANSLKITSMMVINPDETGLTKAFQEGIRFADYRFEGARQKRDPASILTLKKVYFVTQDRRASELNRELSIVFQNLYLTRDLVNLPSNVVTPGYLEIKAREIAAINTAVSVKALNTKEAEKLKMGAFLGVAKGAKEPAKMIALTYKGGSARKGFYALVGKGITFDSGGISIKPSKGMEEMKTDMAGAAAALGAFKSVVELGLKINLIAVVAATENMPDGGAYRPGDVLTASNGKTIEVISTDAEGRLVLADALVYAQKLGANKIIDIATLTGSCISSFGHIHTALMSNNTSWTRKFLAAAEVSGEKTWELPMDDEYGELIKSDVSDVKNSSAGGNAGAITGAKLLELFVEKKTSWIHLDIAGTSFLPSKRDYWQKHATGIPMRTIVELLKAEEEA